MIDLHPSDCTDLFLEVQEIKNYGKKCYKVDFHLFYTTHSDGLFYLKPANYAHLFIDKHEPEGVCVTFINDRHKNPVRRTAELCHGLGQIMDVYLDAI